MKHWQFCIIMSVLLLIKFDITHKRRDTYVGLFWLVMFFVAFVFEELKKKDPK